MATAASCFSTSLQHKQKEAESGELTNRAQTHRDTEPSYLYDPSEGGHMFLQSSFSFMDRTWMSWRRKLLELFLYWWRRTCSSSVERKPQSGRERSEPWPTRAPAPLPAPHLRAKTAAWTPQNRGLTRVNNRKFHLGQPLSPLPPWGGIVVFRICGGGVVWLARGGHFVRAEGGLWWEGGMFLDLGSGRTIRTQKCIIVFFPQY